MIAGRGRAAPGAAAGARSSVLAAKGLPRRGERPRRRRSPPFTAHFWRACGLALLLLFVQHLAQTHALAHLPGDSLVAAAGNDSTDCPQCLALGGLHGSAVAMADSPPLPSASAGPLAFLPAAEPLRRPTTAHAIRAPPENRD